MATFLKRILSPRQVRLENRILDLADETKNYLSSQDLQSIRDDIEHNELGNAFEILCIQLFEYQASISSDTYSKIEALGKEIGIEDKIWTPLKDLLKND